MVARAARVCRARRRSRFSAASLSRASSSAAARAVASALDTVPSEFVDVVRTGAAAPKLPRHAASSSALRGSRGVAVRRASGTVGDARGVIPSSVLALAVSTCSRACAISPSARSRARNASSSAQAALRRRIDASRRQLREKSSRGSESFAAAGVAATGVAAARVDGGVSARERDTERVDARPRSEPSSELRSAPPESLGRRGLVGLGHGSHGGVETERALRRRRRAPPELFRRRGGLRPPGVFDSRVGGIRTIGLPAKIGLSQNYSRFGPFLAGGAWYFPREMARWVAGSQRARVVGYSVRLRARQSNISA